MKNFIPPLVLAACVTASILLSRLWPIVVAFPAPWKYAGLFPLLAGVLICLAGLLGLLRGHTTVRPFSEPRKLVVAGIYKYSRNPIYLGYAVALVGLAITLGALSAALPMLAFVALAHFWYIPFEERMLARKFGEEYREYRTKVRRWI